MHNAATGHNTVVVTTAIQLRRMQRVIFCLAKAPRLS
jgi:hypothetical protein